MFKIARRSTAAFVLLILACNGWVVASPLGNTASRFATQSFTLLSLKHESAGSTTRVVIEASAPPLYTVTRQSDTLVVVDLPADASRLAPAYAVKSAAVDAVNVRSVGSKTISRHARTSIEIAVREEVKDSLKVVGNLLVIELVSAKAVVERGQPGQPGVYVEPTPVSGSTVVQPTPVSATPEVEAKIEKANLGDATAEPEKAQPANLQRATLVRGVRSETFEDAARIVIDTDGAAQFTNFSLTNPHRIVVDITGVRNIGGNKTLSVGALSVDKVRVGQPSANTVRVVIDTRSQTPYRVDREGASVVITVGNTKTAVKAAPQSNTPPQPVASQPALETKSEAAEVKVAGQRVEVMADRTSKPVEPPTASNPVKPEAGKGATNGAPGNAAGNAAGKASSAATDKPQSLKDAASNNAPAQSAKPGVVVNNNTGGAKSGTADVTAQVNRQQQNRPADSRPRTAQPSAREQITQPTGGRSVADLQRQQGVNTTPAVNPTFTQQQPVAQPVAARNDPALCDPSYVGGLISFDLRAGVDLRDMLRFVAEQYGVNFIVDKSVSAVPVDLRVYDLPWNYVLDSVLRANRLGMVCEKGRLIRIATLQAIKEEEVEQRLIAEAQAMKVPLITKIINLRYARAAGTLGAGTGSSGRGGGGGGLNIESGGGGSGGRGGLLAIAEKRLSGRGRIEMDARTNSLIVTDLPEYVAAVEEILIKLDKPESQVEIEARIVVASRNFLRDIGVELAGAVTGSDGKLGVFQTSPVRFSDGGITSGAGSSGGGSGGGSGGSGGSTGSTPGPNLLGPLSNGALTANPANTVLSLTTGIFGTAIISAALSLNETKGQIRTIASPRVTTTDQQPAEIVNGVQIPVQTVSNNTITTTFVTAALRLQITPQIIEENGEVVMRVIAENNTVNTALANQFNNGTPGINTQSAESTVRVPDGGTTVLGGINIDDESHAQNRTPGVSRIPVLGELFKRRTTRRDFSEVLFFITPRIIRSDTAVAPRTLPTSQQPLDGRVDKSSPSPTNRQQ